MFMFICTSWIFENEIGDTNYKFNEVVAIQTSLLKQCNITIRTIECYCDDTTVMKDFEMNIHLWGAYS